MKIPLIVYEKERCNKRQIKCNYKQSDSDKIQRILRKKFNKQITTNRRINKEVSGGKEMSLNYSVNEVKNFLRTIGFNLVDGEKGIYEKSYQKHNNYIIKVSINFDDLSKSIIDYGKKIKLGRKTTCNFSKDENLIVLECIDRLLIKGYSPSDLYLEPKWALGHKEKGFLDILVYEKDKKKSFLMIECKRDFMELDKEMKKTREGNGQIFSYYIQQPETKYLCLYTSEISNSSLKYKSFIINVKNSFRDKSQQEVYEEWNKLFEDNGIFEEEVSPYNINFFGIRKKSLTELEINDGKFIFNQFAEILRKNVVSDKTNAFNKIFNLFLCKIVDEDSKRDEEDMDFQWKEEEDNKQVMLRLNDLYKKGMKEYLKINIADYSEQEIDSLLSRATKESLQKIKEVMIELRLYTNNEFAFREVFDKETFDKNCIIVKEVVKLLEKYKLKYTTRHQFLGDFFERLLNNGIKQEAGQFFTPTPLARFVCKSIPIREIIERKNNEKEVYFLPYVIDFASGSGHFLTECMEEINQYIVNIKDKDIKAGKRAIDIFNSMKNNYRWAEKYIYGIEKDYRLAKTSIISCFLNGDGDANIICADALDSFKSKDYDGILKLDNNSIENPVFDLLISNPPYSIPSFKNTIPNGKDSFGLFKKITNNSSEIECLFVERAIQLLKEGGYTGIILPTSLLNNKNGIFPQTRKMILTHFEIYAIVELGGNTFMETGKNTSIFFMKRRENRLINKAFDIVDKFIKEKKDLDFSGTEGIFSKYVSFFWKDVSFKDYLTIFSKPNEKIISSRHYQDYLEDNNISEEEIIDIEKKKLFFFILNFNQKVVLVKSGEKKEEKKFLGYEFSKRRGDEGIKINVDGNKDIQTKLFDDNNILNKDKVNYYIRKNFLNEEISGISEELKDNLEVVNLFELIDFDSSNSSLFMTTFKKKQIKSNFDKLRIKDLTREGKIEVGSGTNAPQDSKYYENGKYPFIRADNLNYSDNEGYVIPEKNSFVNDLAINNLRLKEVSPPTILFPKSGQSINTDNIVKIKEKAFIVNHLAYIHSEDKEFIDYIFYLLKDYGTSNLQSIINGYPSISLNEDLGRFEIPIPKEEVIKKIIKENKKIEEERKPLLNQIEQLESKLKEIIYNLKGEEKQIYKILIPLKDKIVKIQEKDYRKKGETPIVSQGSELISGYTNEEIKPISKSLPVIVFGDHSKRFKYIDFPFVCGADGVRILKPNGEINPKIFYYLLKNLEIGGDGKYTRHYKYLEKIKIKIPKNQDELLNEIERIEEEIKKVSEKIMTLNYKSKKIIQENL